MSKWSGEKISSETLQIFLGNIEISKEKNAMKERLRSLGEYGEGSRQFNVQIFPLLPSLHFRTSSRRP